MPPPRRTRRTPKPLDRIRTLRVFVTRDGTGEGVLAFRDERGTWQPMVAADDDRVESLKPIAQAIVKETGKAVYLLQFSKRETVETFEPEVAEGQPPGVHVIKNVRHAGPVERNGAVAPSPEAAAAIDHRDEVVYRRDDAEAAVLWRAHFRHGEEVPRPAMELVGRWSAKVECPLAAAPAAEPEPEA